MSTKENEDPLGSALLALRRARGWSLRALSERSGVSAAMLSDIERGTKSPTVRLAYQIARALDCSITDLLGGPSGAATGAIAAPASATVLDDPDSGVRRTSHPNPLLHGQLEVAVYDLAPGASTGVMDANRPGTLETVVILEGEIELVLDGSATLLGPDQSASHGVHATEYRNPAEDRGARIMVLVDTSRC